VLFASLLLFLSFDGDEEEENTRSKPLIWGTPPPPLLLMTIFVRGEHFRALLPLQKQQGRGNKFLVLVSSITFAPLKFLPQNNSRIFLSLLFVTALESNYEQGREWRKREKKIHEHTHRLNKRAFRDTTHTDTMSVIRRHHCKHATKERCARLRGGFVCDSVHFKPVLRVGQTKTSLGKTSF
jgi:hypothetical protein